MSTGNKCFQWVSLIILGWLVTGCGAKFKNISPDDNLLMEQGQSIGLVWISGIQVGPDEDQKFTAKNIQLGNQGLLDMAVNHTLNAKLRNALDKIEVQTLVDKHYFSVFASAFEDVGFTVKRDSIPYCVEQNQNCNKYVELKDTQYLGLYEFPQIRNIYGFDPIIDNMDVDYLLAIGVELIGTGRNYFSMVPTSPPKGVTVVFSYLIERKTGEVVSQHLSTVTEDPKGEWDQPPEYEILSQAAKDSFEIAMDEIYIDIFKQAP